MLGAIIGDIVGSTREWHNIKTTNFELVPLGCRFTDDTVMTLSVAEWLMQDALHRPETLVACMQRLGRQYPDAGYGRSFKQWIWSENAQAYHSYGNGSGMRVSPVGLYARTLKEALELARITASVTHNHPEGIKGAQAIAACVFLKKYGKSDVIIRRFISDYIKYNLHFRLADLRPQYTFDVTCQGSVPIAIQAYLEGEDTSAEYALRLAISMGGDSDTIGAMTAAIADAERFNTLCSKETFSLELVRKCRALLTAELLDINDRFEHFLVQRQSALLREKRTERHSSIMTETIKAQTRDRIRGSLIGGAIGDALGYPIEFMSRNSIFSQYGRRGITTFSLDRQGKALISDDTQMTLFTANGLLFGVTRGYTHGVAGPPESYVRFAYLDWYYTQGGGADVKFQPHTWLHSLPELNSLRAPGNTCLSACEALLHHREVKNYSKGCGGIMRVAPMALLCAGYWSRNKRFYGEAEMDKAGAEIAAITHKHPLGFLPAAMLTHLLFQIIQKNEKVVRASIADMVLDSTHALLNFGNYRRETAYLSKLTREAVVLALNDESDAENIRRLGEGWTGEEVWAIAVYCVARHVDNIEEAILAAVNHDGDSDSTGAICGNIMGAIYGYEVIKRLNLCCPRGMDLEQTLELAPIILSIADDLYTSCIIDDYAPIDMPEKEQWYERYCCCKATFGKR